MASNNIFCGNGLLEQINNYNKFISNRSNKSNGPTIVCSSQMANSFWELVHPHLKSKRVFDPSIDLIKSTFTNVYTRKFLKDCIKISKSDPGLIKLEPDHGYPPSEDIDKLNTFLYLYNASLREEWWLDKNKNKKYYIELYDDPE